MKTSTQAKLVMLLLLAASLQVNAQTFKGLVFKDPVLVSGSDLQLNSVYLFKDVKAGADARVTIAELSNGAKVTKIDDNTVGLGYTDAFQPEVKSPSGLGQSFAKFQVDFYEAGTTIPTSIDQVKATGLDIDGTLLSREFAEIDMDGGVLNYLATTLDISVLNLLLRKYVGENILGIERDGIDTTALGNMFTVTQSAVSSFTLKAGTKRLLGGGSGNRQYSFFMKGFDYIAPITTLPLNFISFNAMLNNSTVDLNWVTASEKNVSHFVVEKSYDGKNFNDAGVVFANGNNMDRMEYNFPDNLKTSQTGLIYYRLRSVDIDTKTQYSEVRVIRLSKQKKQVLTIQTFPNPVVNDLRVSIPPQWQGKQVSFEIISNTGQPIMRKQTGSGSQTETLSISQLARGFYLVRATCNNETAQQKIIKQ